MQNPIVLTTERDSKNDSIFGARREMQRRRRHAPLLDQTVLLPHSFYSRETIQVLWTDFLNTLNETEHHPSQRVCAARGKIKLEL